MHPTTMRVTRLASQSRKPAGERRSPCQSASLREPEQRGGHGADGEGYASKPAIRPDRRPSRGSVTAGAMRPALTAKTRIPDR